MLSYEVLERIQIPLDSSVSTRTIKTQLIETDSTRILAVMPSNTMSIDFYDLKNGEKFHSIKFSTDGRHRVNRLNGFEYLNVDTVFVVNYPPAIMIFDFEGNKINQVKIEGEDQYVQSIMSTNSLPLFITQGKILGAYPFITRFWETPSKQVSDFKHIYEIDKKNDLSLAWKEFYLPNGFWDKGKVSPSFSWALKGDSILTLFNEDPRIQIFSISQNRVLDLVELQAPERFEFVRYFKRPDGNKGVLNELDKGVFRNIIYDAYRKVYYVFYDLPANPEKYVIPIYELHVVRPDFKIFVLDEKFNYLGESKFIDFEGDSYGAFVGKAGLYLPVNGEYNEYYTEDFLLFDVLHFNLTASNE